MMVFAVCHPGSIQAEWSSLLENITILDLSSSQLSGSLPGFTQGFQKLNVLNLQNNKLTGTLPVGKVLAGNDSLAIMPATSPMRTRASCSSYNQAP